jgi:hypothetical protein
MPSEDAHGVVQCFSKPKSNNIGWRLGFTITHFMASRGAFDLEPLKFTTTKTLAIVPVNYLSITTPLITAFPKHTRANAHPLP